MIRILLFLLLPTALFAQLSGKVISVHDGDTFTLLDSANNKVKVRLHGIDCPELKQEFGDSAKRFVNRLCYQKKVKIDIKDTDKYGRTVGIVRVEGSEFVLNEQLLMYGLAWHYKKYDHSFTYPLLEAAAKSKGLAIWSTPSPIPPWEFRATQ